MSNYVWPSDKHVVTSGFRTASRPNHNGTDLANTNGAGNIYAFADGVVTAKYAYNQNCYNWGSGNIRMGNALFIKHDALGLRSDYQHMAAFAPGIGVGSKVKKGQIIGTIGNTGASNGAHLHFGLHNGKDYIDPMIYLNNAGNPGETQDGVKMIGIYYKTDKTPSSQLLAEGSIAAKDANGIVSIYDRRISREVTTETLSPTYEELRDKEMQPGELIAVANK